MQQLHGSRQPAAPPPHSTCEQTQMASMRATNSLLTTHYPLPTTTTQCPPLTTHCYYSLPTTHYSLPTTHYSLLTAPYSLPTTHYSLLTTHYSLLITFRSAALAVSLTQDYVIGPHCDDSEGTYESVAFLSSCNIPASTDWHFFSAGLMHPLPKAVGQVRSIQDPVCIW